VPTGAFSALIFLNVLSPYPMRDYLYLLNGWRMVVKGTENKNAQKIVQGAHFFVHGRRL
jgi:hypothetical protein